jgi:hypothetical protein
MRAVDVTMKLRRWNKNFVGTHYGGSLYSMADPFFMVMLIQNLGREYIVWDKAATIRFRKPGRGMVKAQFRLTEAVLEDIRTRLDSEHRSNWPKRNWTRPQRPTSRYSARIRPTTHNGCWKSTIRRSSFMYKEM